MRAILIQKPKAMRRLLFLGIAAAIALTFVLFNSAPGLTQSVVKLALKTAHLSATQEVLAKTTETALVDELRQSSH